MKSQEFKGFGKVIKKYRTSNNYSQAELATLVDVSRNTVINWENEKCQPDMASIQNLCITLSIPVAELFQLPSRKTYSSDEIRMVDQYRSLSTMGKQLILKTISSISESEIIERDTKLRENYRIFEHPTSSAAAGTGSPFGDAHPIPKFAKITPANQMADAIITVNGKSMEPIYHSGDQVYVYYTTECNPGDVVICSTNEGAVIKMVKEDRTLFSLNPAFPFGPHSEDNHVRIIGQVLGIVQYGDIPTKQKEHILHEIFYDEVREFNKKYGE